VEHPLTDGAVPYTEERLVAIADNPEELAMALRSCLRYLVSLYLAYWPITRRWEEDMISVGMVATVEFAQNLTPEQRPILKYASMRIRRAIEDYVNVQRGIALPSRGTQERVDGLEPGGIANIEEIDEPANDDPAQKTVDLVDALEHLNMRCELARAMLQPEMWAMTNVELAEEFGVSESTVSRTRTELYAQYKDLLDG
jgi:RNA polymerase sigma factor (sigma-70 family)